MVPPRPVPTLSGTQHGMPERPPKDLAQLLQTDDPVQQSRAVEMLLQPTITLVIQADPKQEQVTVMALPTSTGEQVPIQVVYRMLTAAQEAIMQKLTEQLHQTTKNGAAGKEATNGTSFQ